MALDEIIKIAKEMYFEGEEERKIGDTTILVYDNGTFEWEQISNN